MVGLFALRSIIIAFCSLKNFQLKFNAPCLSFYLCWKFENHHSHDPDVCAHVSMCIAVRRFGLFQHQSQLYCQGTLYQQRQAQDALRW